MSRHNFSKIIIIVFVSIYVSIFAMERFMPSGYAIKEPAEVETQQVQEITTSQSVSLSNSTTEKPKLSRGEIDRSNNRKISKFLSNALEGQAENIIKYSNQYNVNPRLITAIILHETDHGRSYAIRHYKNVGGLMGDNGLRKFDTLKQSIEFMCGNLKTLYIDQGLTSIDLIQPVYCPIGAANDPNHTNEAWLPVVTKLYNQITNTEV